MPLQRHSCCSMVLAAMSTNSCRSRTIWRQDHRFSRFVVAFRSMAGTLSFGVSHRSIDEADISSRAAILADFIEAATRRYSLTRAPIAMGFSNGAIMVAALLLTRTRLLAGAILFRPLSPFRDDMTSSLNGTPVLIIDGEKDTRRSPGDGTLLAERLTRAWRDSHPSRAARRPRDHRDGP
jgi:predicted esterase